MAHKEWIGVDRLISKPQTVLTLTTCLTGTRGLLLTA